MIGILSVPLMSNIHSFALNNKRARYLSSWVLYGVMPNRVAKSTIMYHIV